MVAPGRPANAHTVIQNVGIASSDHVTFSAGTWRQCRPGPSDTLADGELRSHPTHRGRNQSVQTVSPVKVLPFDLFGRDVFDASPIEHRERATPRAGRRGAR